MKQNPYKEALLAGLRIVVIAIIPVTVSILTGLQEGESIDWRIAGLALLITALKALDEYIHTVGKNEKSDSLMKGLVRF